MIWKRIMGWFKEDPTRLRPKNVKVGEWIIIYHDNGALGVAAAECLGNDPKTKKMFVRILWGNNDGSIRNEYLTLSYDGSSLKDFHLLNSGKIDARRPQTEGGAKSNIDENNIASLQNGINQAIAREDYETADRLQKQIDKLLKK